ncbi:MAG: WhiB family transcriptional regulator [Actinomycetia bacterium]|nr:WhiB family transcriptional regulator [Actinomycetes bacterium]
MAGVDLLTLADLYDRPAWMADASCREHPDLPWVPSRGPEQAHVPAMQAVCSGCLVRDECYAFAVDHGEQGVWGGTSARQRQHRPIAA